MDPKSRTLKRLGVVGLGAAVMLGTPAVGFLSSASASPATTISIQSQYTGNGSIENDGTNTTVKISALLGGAGGQTPSGDVVNFYYQPSTGAGSTTPQPGTSPTLIATDTAAPYSTEWAPPSGGNFIETAKLVHTATGAVDASSAPVPVSVGSFVADHITSPADGSMVGVSGQNIASPSGTPTNTGWIAVSGTRSTEKPAVTIYTRTVNNTTGAVTANYITGTPSGGTTTSATPTGGTPQVAAGGSSTNWSAVVPVQQCPGASGSAGSAGCDVLIYTTASGGSPANGTSDEVAQATLYEQTAANVTVTIAPQDPTQPVNSPQTYTITATDSNGNPVVGLDFVTCADNNSLNAQFAGDDGVYETTTQTVNTCTGPKSTTDSSGKAIVKAKDATAEKTPFHTYADFGGATNVGGSEYTAPTSGPNAADSLTTYTPTATSAKFVVTPDKALYASNPPNGGSEYTAYTSGNQTTGNFPQTELCFTDQNGNPFVVSNTPPSNLFVTENRSAHASGSNNPKTNTFYTNDPSQAGQPGFAGSITLTPDATDNNCYDVQHYSASGLDGTDTYSATETGVTFTSKTLKFAGLTVNGDNAGTTQGNRGKDVQSTFTVLGTDGTPFANRKISLVVTTPGPGGATFSTQANQPSDVSVTDSTHAVCTSSSTGVCTYDVTEPTNSAATSNDTAQVTATDNISNASQIGTTQSAVDTFTFTNSSLAVTGAALSNYVALYPDGTFADEAGEPGAPVQFKLHITAGNGTSASPTTVLANTPVTLTTSDGFFTPNSTNGGYSGLTPAGTPTAGGTAGALKNLGSSITVDTDSSGNLTVTIDVERDSAFDNNNGELLDALTVAANGGSLTIHPQDASTPGYTWSTNEGDTGEAPLNPGSVTIVAQKNPATGTNSPLSGSYNNTDNAGNQFFAVQQTDQFGNLVSTDTCAVALTVPANEPGLVNNSKSSCDDGVYNDGTGNGSPPDVLQIDSPNATTTKQDTTLTAKWTNQSTVYTTPASGNAVTQAGTSSVSDSFTVQYYNVDLTNLTFNHTVKPADVVTTGTTVQDQVQILDQYGAADQGQPVTFHQSGPGAGVDITSTIVTNTQGVASYNFSSSIQGNATVTDTVTGPGNVVLDSATKTIGFDSTPTINVSPSSAPGTHNVTISGSTRPGASVQLMSSQNGAGFTPVGSPQTADGNGNYSFTESVSSTTSYEVVVDNLVTSDQATATVTSAPHKRAIHPRIRVSSTKRHVHVVVFGPKHDNGAAVTFVARINGKVKTVGKSNLKGGEASLTFTAASGSHVSVHAKVAHHRNFRSGKTISKSVIVK